MTPSIPQADQAAGAPDEAPGRSGAPAASRVHVPSLDGLRTAAVASVMLFHAGFPGTRPLGALGVDLFFVLSGFLITTLLVRERDRRGRISLGRFWGRRFLRLMPAYYLYAGFITLAILAFRWGNIAEGRDHGWTVGDLLLSIWLYFVNYAPAYGLWSYSDWVIHLWSLAVEEQFYLIWPPILAMAFHLRRPVWVGWGLVAAIAIRRMFYYEHELEHRLDGRGIGIMLGCAVALSLSGPAASAARRAVGSPWVRVVAIAGVAALWVACMAGLNRGLLSTLAIARYAEPAFDLLFVALIASLYYGPADPISRALSTRAVVYLGKISYGVYLYHMICRFLVWEVLLAGIEGWPSAPKYLLRLSAFAALSVGMASLSYYALERPFLALKERLR